MTTETNTPNTETTEPRTSLPRRLFLQTTAVVAGTTALVSSGVSATDDEEVAEDETEDSDSCYTVDIDNEFTPFPVGRQLTLQGEEEDDEGETVFIQVRITVLDETEKVGDVTTRVVEEREWEAEQEGDFTDETLVEVSRNYYAQTCTGTVWYFGEAVDIFEDGEIVGSEGAWRADDPGNAPGIYIPAQPVTGSIFQREVAPGVAEDIAEVTDEDLTVEVPFDEFDGCIELFEWNPLEGGEGPEDGDRKIFAPGIGLIVDEAVELTEFDPGE